MRNSYLIVFVFFISALSYGQYCTPINTSCFSDNRIGVVKSYNAVEDLNYTFSGSCTSNGYRNETSDTLAVRPGDQIHLVLTGMDGFVDPAFYIVFVDWNLAGNFTAQMEVWNSSTVLVSGAAVMASFTVPIGAAIGNTRMRIKKLSNTNVSPCSGGGNQGEIIDFSVRVQTVGACIAPPIILSVAASNELTCLGKSVLLFPTFQQTGPGMQYQWQSSSDQTAWGNISGSNTPAVAVSPISTLFYRLIASCGASTDTSLSLLVSPITALADAITVNPTVPISASNVHTNRQLSFLLQCAPVTLPTVVNYINPSSPLPDFLKLVDIAGLSATNTLIINGNGAELVPERTTFEHGVIHFDNVQFVTLNDFSVHIPASLGGNSVKCIQLTNNASDNTIQNCTLEMPINNTQFLYGIAGFNGNQSPITDGTPNPCERLTVANTIIKGGRYGALLRASNVNTPMSGIVFQNNQILDFQEFGIRFQFTNGTQILQNEFSRATRTTNLLSAGAFCVSAIENTSYRIDDNYFHNLIFPTNTSFSTSAVAISSINNPGTPTAVSVISNNLILAENLFRGNVSGVSLQGTDRYVKCVHNTIQLEAAPTTTNFMTFNGVVTIGGFSSQNFMGCAISNNIFGGRLASASQSFFALNFTQGAFSVIPTDNNVFYDANPGVGNYFIGVFGLNRQYATLGSWQQGEGLDSNSRFDDPNYLGAANQDSAFIPQNGAIHSIGANFNVFAPLDRLGVARPVNPAPGAYQFSVPNGVAPDLVNSPTLDSILCQGTTPLLLVIDNLGSDTMTSVTLVRRVNGLPIDTIVIAQPFPPRTPQTVSTGPFSFVVNAVYNIEFEVIASTPTPPLSFGNQTLGYPATRVGMEGSYTMNPAAPATTTNYQSITAFVSALQTRGLCGHVTLNLAPNLSPLDEQVTFVDIETNASKTITIIGSGNVLFSSALSNQQRSVVRIIGVDFITIDSLNIEATANLRYAVHIDDNASNITLRNSHLIGIQGNQRGEAGVSVAGSL
ncbi:MAG: GEVED domain-containing protein, partial [Schleiferiaceae bacterium]|nr:GEVED domain-containing protein [Schleiferiaceae bacterium]